MRFALSVLLLLEVSLVAADEALPGAPMEDPTGCALERFHRALGDTERTTPIRIVHLGDSHVAGDYWTGEIRRRLQERFGVGGPGLMVPGQPWRSHRHTDVRLGQSGTWDVVRMNRAVPEDGLLGLTGVALVSETPGAAVWAESSPGAEGAVVSKLEVHYVAQPGGGRIAIWIDGRRETAFSTDATAGAIAFWEGTVEEGPHRIEVRHVAGGPVRILGVVMERERGLVYDALGTNGARIVNLDRTDAATFRTQLERRSPALVVLAFGTNEVDDEEIPPDAIGTAALATLRRVREAAPRSSCLVVAPPDRCQENDDGEWKTCPRIPPLVDAMRSAALRAGCAYWDEWAAMGGSESIARWAAERPALAARDHVHLTATGYRLLAGAFSDALFGAHQTWLERRAIASAPTTTASATSD